MRSLLPLVELTASRSISGPALAVAELRPAIDGLGRRTVTPGAVRRAASLVALVAPNVQVLMAARCPRGRRVGGLAISRAIVRDLFQGERSSRGS